MISSYTAGITDLNIHDLRHTAATRMALKCGNVFIVQALTGHKTLSQLERYVNVNASDVVKVMHAPVPATASTSVAVPASVEANPEQGASDPAPAEEPESVDVVGNLVRVDFGKRQVA